MADVIGSKWMRGKVATQEDFQLKFKKLLSELIEERDVALEPNC